MATSCTVIAKLSDGTFGSIYVYCNGGTTGEILDSFYREQSKIDELISFGNAVYIGKFIHNEDGPNCCPHCGHKTNEYDFCKFFRRDEFEYGHEAIISDTFEQAERDNFDDWQYYQYLWDGEKWTFRHTAKWYIHNNPEAPYPLFEPIKK